MGRGKADWQTVREQVPWADHDEWRDRLAERPDVLHRIIADAYQAALRDGEVRDGVRRSGRRPRPSRVPLDEVLAEVFPEQYSTKPFREALTDLVGCSSQRAFAARAGINQSTLSRLMSGTFEPDVWVMECCAAAGDVAPWYFLEWRAGYVAQLVEEALLADVQLSIGAVRGLRLAGRGAT